MLRTVNADELRQMFSSLWKLSSGCDWKATGFDMKKAAIAATMAQIAYIRVTDDERERALRGKILPSEIWMEMVRQDIRIDIVEIARSADFADIRIVTTRHFVAIMLKIGDVILIGVRGTQFSYDWPINLAADKVIRGPDAGDFFHRGFYDEGRLLSARIARLLWSDPAFAEYNARSILLCGHSLGGAVSAAIAARGIGSYKPSDGYSTIEPCYIFGAPRLAGDYARFRSEAFAVRRPGDLVPRVVPKSLGYRDYVEEFSTRGLDWRSDLERRPGWFGLQWARRFGDMVLFREHNIERYREEILAAL
jgi:hypothetical protein